MSSTSTTSNIINNVIITLFYLSNIFNAGLLLVVGQAIFTMWY